MNTLTELIQTRRSAANFIEGEVITQEDLDEIFELVKLAPSAFNLQHARYIAVLDPKLKQQVKEAANGQYKVQTASAVLVVVGDMQAYMNADKIFDGLLQLGMLNKQEFEQLISNIHRSYESGGERYQRDEAIRNASLSAMLFMMAAKDKDWDTCPMIGFDAQQISELLELKDTEVPALMIAIGKAKESSQKPRGYRKPLSELVDYR